MKRVGIVIVLLICGLAVSAQKITVDADNYKHRYVGGGISYGLYKDHIWSMSDNDEDAFFQLMYGDVKMQYVQYYASKYPELAPEEFNKVQKFVEKSRVHEEDVELVFVCSKIPDSCSVVRIVDGSEKNVLDVDDPLVYDRYASWMLQLMNGMYERGTLIDIFSMANEPDWDRKWMWGYESSKIGLAVLVQEAIPKLKVLLGDVEKNPYGLECPQIMAPANIFPSGCYNYITYWKANYPLAWEQVDIVATHQYGNGDNWSTFEKIKAELDGRRFIQSEQHVSKGDNLGPLPVDEQTRGVLSMMSFFNASVNNGVDSWYYFVPNYPMDYHNGGLMQIAWGKAAKPYKTYYSFKQLNSIQSDSSHVMGRSLSGLSNVKVVAFRKQGENKVVVHVGNIGGSKTVSLEILGENSEIDGIVSLKHYLTDANHDLVLESEQDYAYSFKNISLTLPAYSLSSFELEIDESGYTNEMQSQDIGFTLPETLKLSDSPYDLSATASSGLPVSYEVVSGEASIEGSILSLIGLGSIEIEAKQEGGGEYAPASPVTQGSIVFPEEENIAIYGSASASSEYSIYAASKSIDGNREHNDSRWLCANEGQVPQWLEIDLGAKCMVNAYSLWTGFNGYTDPIRDFRLESWTGSAWKALNYITNNEESVYFEEIAETETEKLRLYVFGMDEMPIRLYEVEVYGKKVVSTADKFDDKSIQLYPNPVNSILNVSGIEQAEMSLTDLSGRIVFQAQLNTLNNSLAVSGLQSGIHICTIQKQGKRIHSEWLVVGH